MEILNCRVEISATPADSTPYLRRAEYWENQIQGF